MNETTSTVGGSSNYSYGGSGIAGVGIPIDDTGYRPNNNVFIRPSIEGTAPEYHVEVRGSDNTFINPRWETAPPDTPGLLMYGVDAINNVFMGMMRRGSNNVGQWRAGTVQRVFDRSAIRKYGSATEGVIVAANNYSDNVGVLRCWGQPLTQHKHKPRPTWHPLGPTRAATNAIPTIIRGWSSITKRIDPVRRGSSATDVVMQRYGGDKVGLGWGHVLRRGNSIGSRYYWTDSAGKLRSHTSGTIVFDQHGRGVIVGTQT